VSERADALPAVLADVAGVAEGESAFVDGPALWANGKEILHRDSGGHYDVRLTRAVIRDLRPRLRADGHVRLRRSGSDWVEVDAEGREGELLLAELVALAARAHQPPPGATALPPPDAAGLARRRRFH